MKKLLLLLTVSVLVFSCQVDEGPVAEESVKRYSSEQAKSFFEEYFQSRPYSVLTRGYEPNPLFGMEISPKWEQSAERLLPTLYSIDVPIRHERRLVARYYDSDFVEVVQKLVIVKEPATEREGAYILTLIPDASFEGELTEDSFINLGETSGFSGFALYSIALTEYVALIERYVDGTVEGSWGIFGSDEQNRINAGHMETVLGALTFGIIASPATRGGDGCLFCGPGNNCMCTDIDPVYKGITKCPWCNSYNCKCMQFPPRGGNGGPPIVEDGHPRPDGPPRPPYPSLPPDFGGGGYTPPPKPPVTSKPAVEPKDPCANMKNKMQNQGFMGLLDILETQAKNHKYEAGRSYTYSNGVYSFQAHDGNPGEPWIDWQPSPTKKIDGFIHTHYQGTLPIFSVSDLFIFNEWKEAINDNFTLGLVTKDAVFFLTVTDMNKYNTFINNYLSDLGLDALSIAYKGIYGIKEEINSKAAADALVKFLSAVGSGLTLTMKRKSDTEFKRGDLSSGGVNFSGC